MLSRSALDLRESLDDIAVDINLSETSSSSTSFDTEDNTNCLNSDKKNKINFWFNLFSRKSHEHKEMKVEEGKWRWRTPKLPKRKNSNVSDGTLKHVRSGADISYPPKFDIDSIFRTPETRKYSKMGIGSTPCLRKNGKQNKDLNDKRNTDSIYRHNTDASSKRNKYKEDFIYCKQSNQSNDSRNTDLNDNHNTDFNFRCITDSHFKDQSESKGNIEYTPEWNSLPVENFKTNRIKTETQ